jgi:ParB family transcriptional regulator, chromosome partitioning protein
LPLSDIRPHPGQPRRFFDEDALNELAQSIKQRGVIQPVIVRPRANSSGYELVAGERRWRAAQRARLHEIPAIISDLSDEDTMAIALIENIQREDLNAVEEAQAYQRLVDEQGYSQAEIATMVDKSRSHIANLMRLLVLPTAVLQMVAEKRLSMGHARALINADNAGDIAQDVIDKGLSVRQVEKLIRQGKSGNNGSGTSVRSRKAGEGDSDIAAVERHLEDLLGLKVQITSDADPKSGSVTIRYTSLDQLDLICQRLSGDII